MRSRIRYLSPGIPTSPEPNSMSLRSAMDCLSRLSQAGYCRKPLAQSWRFDLPKPNSKGNSRAYVSSVVKMFTGDIGDWIVWQTLPFLSRLLSATIQHQTTETTDVSTCFNILQPSENIRNNTAPLQGASRH
jgi:hypothetical protein